MLNNNQLNNLKKVLLSQQKIKLVYFFGSRAINNHNLSSDYDFAIFLDCHDQQKRFYIRNLLLDKISQLLKSDKIDILILNDSQNAILKYNIIKFGKLIYEVEPYKLLIESKILNQYFDYQYFIKKYHSLTGRK